MRHGLLRCALLLAALASPGRAAAEYVYLAIGDSSAFGETDRTQNPSNGDRGYVAPFADYLKSQNGGVRPTVLNTAIDGETTKSFFTGNVADRVSNDGVGFNTNYNAFAPNYPSQVALIQQLVGDQIAKGNTIGTVTVQLGANNLFATAEAPDFLGLSPAEQQARVLSTLAAVQQDYVRVLGTVRALLPAADLYVLGYHNPYGGLPGHPLYPLSGVAVRGLNQVIRGVGTNPAFGGKYVDIYGVISGREGELTLMTATNDNVHLNDAGYRVAAQELIRTASPVPAPPGVVLLAAGGVLVLGRRALRRASRGPSGPG